MAAQEWSEAGRKRVRDDEYGDIAVGGSLGFTEHRSKRLQALPVRTSPTSKRWSVPSFPPPSEGPDPSRPRTITPSDSDSDSEDAQAHADFGAPTPHMPPWSSSCPAVMAPPDPSPFPHAPELVDAYAAGDTDMDVDADPELLQPGLSQPDPPAANLTGRMPTPIHCSFAAQVRGNSWGGPAHGSLNPIDLTPPYQADSAGFNAPSAGSHGQSLPVPGQPDHPAGLADWDMVQNRRLPSPISESGGEDGGLQGMALDHPAAEGYGRPGGFQRACSAMEFSLSAREVSVAGSAVSDTDAASPASAAAEGMMDVEPSPGTPSPRKGHTRSRHTVNNWTLQPGMKKSFSIGYRADCEKCRMKVPGHFNHIIIS